MLGLKIYAQMSSSVFISQDLDFYSLKASLNY